MRTSSPSTTTFILLLFLVILKVQLFSQQLFDHTSYRSPVTELIQTVPNDTLLTKKEEVEEVSDMVRIPAGNFIMGSDNFEIDEQPVREVFIDEFWIDKYPVTNADYARFLNGFLELYPDRASEISTFIDLQNEQTKIRIVQNRYVPISPYENHPVINVSWYGANEYAKLNHKRLPTEAEWEKAARGTDARLYPWGNSIDSSNANYWDSKDPFENGTSPVGFYDGHNFLDFRTTDSPSPFGVYDLVGNVKEWVSDWYQYNYYANSRTINPPGPKTGTKKVIRGGGYLFNPDKLRATYRYALEPNKTKHYVGFRCVRSTQP